MGLEAWEADAVASEIFARRSMGAYLRAEKILAGTYPAERYDALWEWERRAK